MLTPPGELCAPWQTLVSVHPAGPSKMPAKMSVLKLTAHAGSTVQGTPAPELDTAPLFSQPPATQSPPSAKSTGSNVEHAKPIAPGARSRPARSNRLLREGIGVSREDLMRAGVPF